MKFIWLFANLVWFLAYSFEASWILATLKRRNPFLHFVNCMLLHFVPTQTKSWLTTNWFNIKRPSQSCTAAQLKCINFYNWSVSCTSQLIDPFVFILLKSVSFSVGLNSRLKLLPNFSCSIRIVCSQRYCAALSKTLCYFKKFLKDECNFDRRKWLYTFLRRKSHLLLRFSTLPKENTLFV